MLLVLCVLCMQMLLHVYYILILRILYCRPPLDDHDDCDGVKYFAQLNMYRYILGKYYDINVSQMYLVSLSGNQENYVMVHAPKMDEMETICQMKDVYVDI